MKSNNGMWYNTAMNHPQTPTLTSAKNPLIKHIKQLSGQAKYRREHGETLLDGVHVCESYLALGQQPRHMVIAERALKNPEVEQLRAQVEPARVAIVSDDLLRSLSPVEHGVGVLLVITVPETADVPPLDRDALLLDGVQDPGNVGTLLRTAAAAGVTRVYLSPDSASVWAPKVIRAGMGAQFGLELYEQCDLASLLDTATVPVYATSLEATATLYEADVRQQAAWLFGSEGRGVTASLLEKADKTVIIPQATAVESLNVAAAAAVCLFEQRRQRMIH